MNKYIVNTASVTDLSSAEPVIYLSNTVQTLVRNVKRQKITHYYRRQCVAAEQNKGCCQCAGIFALLIIFFM